MILLHDQMPITATRKEWYWTWLRTNSPDAMHDGTLSIREESGVRIIRTITDVYRVQETPLFGRPGRAFLLLKDDHKGDLDTVAGRKSAERIGEVYELHLYADGFHRCTCTAGEVKRHACLHALAMAEVIDHEGLPEPPTAQRQPMPKKATVERRGVYTEAGGL